MISTFTTRRGRVLRRSVLALVGAGAICAAATPAIAVGATATATDLTPNGVATDGDGNVYVSDIKDRVVYRVGAGGDLTVVAGRPGQEGLPTPGPAVASALSAPSGLTVDRAGNLYIADAGTDHAVVKVDPAGTLSVVAGVPGQYSLPPVSGPATSSQLRDPAALAVDGDDLYIADQWHSVVSKVDGAGMLSILAGRPAVLAAPLIGPASASSLSLPSGVAVDAEGNVFIADMLNHVVSKVDASGDLSIVAGNGEAGTPFPGYALGIPLALPAGLTFDRAGNLYIADPGSHTVLKLNPDGDLSIVAGTGKSGAPTEGPATSSDLQSPTDVAVDPDGNLYVSDGLNNVVVKIDTSGDLSVFAGTGRGLTYTRELQDVTCTGGTLKGEYQSVTVEAGATCRLSGARVRGDIKAEGAEAVIIRGARVDGSITITDTASAVELTESTVRDDVTIDATGGPVSVANNTIGGTLKVTNSKGPEDSALVLANEAKGGTSCTGTAGLAEACNAGAKTPQTITFTSTPPSSPVVGGTYEPEATGGDSGNPVTFTIGDASDPDVCRLDAAGTTVSFVKPGSCVVVADQSGDDDYLAAPSVKQTLTVTQSASPPSVTVSAPVKEQGLRAGGRRHRVVYLHGGRGWAGYRVLRRCRRQLVGREDQHLDTGHVHVRRHGDLRERAGHDRAGELHRGGTAEGGHHLTCERRDVHPRAGRCHLVLLHRRRQRAGHRVVRRFGWLDIGQGHAAHRHRRAGHVHGDRQVQGRPDRHDEAHVHGEGRDDEAGGSASGQVQRPCAGHRARPRRRNPLGGRYAARRRDGGVHRRVEGTVSGPDVDSRGGLVQTHPVAAGHRVAEQRLYRDVRRYDELPGLEGHDAERHVVRRR